ncbi:WD repeat-containing protein on Y chromosome [Aphidius gifuensis]|uniref:WD repeat-containing protein on Y chromosome n=1 Tax=Aphidius gifuensis TaxID=684658 RepID=UPI001CDBBF5B|nr:WD repeat-containing protein on Y chromosome [Aphidius gifuensis]
MSITKEDFHVLFKRMDSMRDKKISWDEFLSYLLLEYRIGKIKSQKIERFELPLTQSPEIKNSKHHSVICRIVFCPEILLSKNRKTSFNSGCYLTASRDGTINYWSLDFVYQRSVKPINPNLHSQPTIITDLIAMPDVQIICTSSADNSGPSIMPFIILFSQGKIDGLLVTEFNKIHSNWVSQVAYYGTLRGFISCSKCSKCSLIYSDVIGTKMKYKFNVNLGISCFTYCEGKQILITGGPDCLIRLWKPYVPSKPVGILRGHRTPISKLIINEDSELLYSLSKNMSIKVWDISTQDYLQTYNNLPDKLSHRSTISVLFNSVTQKIIIASTVIVLLQCDKAINEALSDGDSHAGKVTCVIYNPLFKVIASTSTDSCIIIWDPWQGKRLHCITSAHNKFVKGNHVEVEIISAAFDFSYQFLVTGGRDGSVKVWSFSSGACVKNMSTESQSAITGIVWLRNRLVLSSWNRITEFADTEIGIYKKSWKTKHTDDIVCTDYCTDTLVTASYNGELVFWKIDTGVAYKRYQVMNPTENTIDEIGYGISTYKSEKLKKENSQKHGANELIKIEKNIIELKKIVPIRSVLFLCSRKIQRNIGTLLVSLDSGLIQVWSHHQAGGFIESFNVVHVKNDCCLSMATDPDNEFLITGHVMGYLKIWLLKNYIIEPVPKISMPALRLEFPFLWKDRIPGRAKRRVKNQPLPLLLSSFKGHSKPVNALKFLPGARLIVSGSSDHTIRLWTLSGRYIGTFGSSKNWPILVPNIPAREYLRKYRLPPEVKRIGSSTTIKVLKGGYIGANIDDDDDDDTEKSKKVPLKLRHVLFSERFVKPINNNDRYEAPRPELEANVTLDTSYEHIPAFSHLKIYNIDPIKN